MSSLDNKTQGTTNNFNKRPRPTAKLKLNVNIKPFEDKNIIVAQNSTSSYLIQNHPSITDLSESVSSSKYIFKKVFFGDNYESKNSENFSHLGNHFYIIQKSNGKEMQDTVNYSSFSSSLLKLSPSIKPKPSQDITVFPSLPFMTATPHKPSQKSSLQSSTITSWKDYMRIKI